MEWRQSVQYLQAKARDVISKIVADTYIDFNVKEDTRQQCGGKPAPRTLISGSQQKIPQR